MPDAALLAVRLVLAAVFVVAALAKLADRDGARRSLVDFGVPAGLAPAAAVGLPLVELLLAAGLVMSSTAWAAALGAAVLLGAFTLAVGVALARGRESDCHCFGRLSAEPVGRGTLARNLTLLALASFAAVAARDDAGTSATAWLGDLSTGALLGLAGGVALVAGLALNFAFLYQLFKQNGRLWAELEQLRATAGGRQGPAIGAPAPRFELPDLSGRAVALDDLLADDRATVLVFSDPQCSACDALLPVIASLERDPAADPKPVLISRGSAEQVRAKVSDHGVERVLLTGEDFELAKSFGVTGTPGAVVIDGAGRIAAEAVLGTRRVDALLASGLEEPALLLVEAG
jgi:methylamine dehydrogenase accessory protein MauD